MKREEKRSRKKTRLISFKLSFATTVIYVLCLIFTKLSILCLYIRVLTYNRVRLAAKILLAFVLLSHAFILLAVFTTCVPLSAYWDLDPAARAKAYCHPIFMYWLHAALNIITDFLIFMLPLTVLHKIRSPRPEKIALCVVFTLAFSVCVISLVRVVILARDLGSGAVDLTWEAPKASSWNAFEIHMAIVCACLTTMKPLVGRYWPGLLSPYPSALQDGDEEEHRRRQRREGYGETRLSTVDRDQDRGDAETGSNKSGKEHEEVEIVVVKEE